MYYVCDVNRLTLTSFRTNVNIHEFKVLYTMFAMLISQQVFPFITLTSLCTNVNVHEFMVLEQ